MLKAMLIISALSGVGSDHKIPFETMEECLDARTVVEKQEAYIATLCIPYDPIVDERNRVEEFFSLFKEIINEMQREKDELYRLEQCDRQWDKCNEQSHSGRPFGQK